MLEIFAHFPVYISSFYPLHVGRVNAVGLDGTGVKSRWGARFSAPVQTAPGAHPASYAMDTGSFPGVGWPGHGIDYPTLSRSDFKERVELYIYSLLGFHVLLKGEFYIYLYLYPFHILCQTTALQHTHTHTKKMNWRVIKFIQIGLLLSVTSQTSKSSDSNRGLCSCDLASWAKREERIPRRCNNINDLLSTPDVDYWLLSRHVSVIFMPIIRRKDHVLRHMGLFAGSVGCGWLRCCGATF